LIQDKQEQIAEIIWRVDGKIFAIVRDAGSAKSNLVFDYDPMGNRIAKHEYSNDNFPDNGIGSPIYEPDVDRDAANWIKSTYYNRDAQGNVMAIYEYDVDTDNNVSHYTLAERNIYGSSRVGMNIHEVEMISATNITDHVFSFIGKRQYELSNHLGNVLSVISDRKFAFDENTDGTIDYYEPDVLLTYDYSPFGVILTESEDGIANAGSGDIPADLHWTFDGGDLTEQNGTGLDVTVFNGPVAISDRCNVSDNALLFDGVDDYATVPDDPQLEFGQNDFTVAVWVKKISQTTHGNTAVGNWKGGGASPGQNEWILTTAAGSNGTGEAVFSIESGSTIYKVEASSNIGFGNWAHIVGVRRGEYLEIYLDGVLSGSKYVGNITMNNMNRDMLIDGMYGNSQMLLSNSVIDDIRIYNRALSDGEVYGLYALGGCTNSMTAGSGDVPADFRWTFDGGSLTEENGTGLNVTLFNGVSVATGRCNQGDGLYFDGADDYATIPDDPQLDFEGDDFSIAVWAKKVSATTFGNAVVGNWRSGAAQGDNEWNLGIGSGTNGTGPSAFSIESGTTRYSAWSTSGITLGEWVHVVGVRNGDYLEIYMNGVLEGTTFIGNVSVNNLNRDLIIASIYGASTQRYTDVVIDDIRMYNRALSSGEVYTLYVLGGCTGPVAGSVEPQRSFVKTVATETTFLMEDFPIQDDFNDGTTQGWIELSTSAEASNVNNSLAIEKDGGGQAVGVGKQFTTIAGYHYYFSALVDKGSCNAASLIDIRIEDNTGALIYNTTLGSGSQTFTFDFVAPTSSTYTIEFERIGNNSNCTFYVDDVEIREEYESTLCEFKDYDAYRYGHNGMERDDEVSGDGNSYTTEYRAYNPRLARWTSLDPLMAYYPNMSGYVAFANCPVYFSDPTGLAPEGGEDPPVEEVRKQNNVYTSEFTPLLPENPAHGQIITYEFVTSDTDGEVVSMSYSWNEHEKDWAVTKTSENPFNPLADESSYILSWGGAKNPYVNGILIDAITGEANVPIVSKTEPEPSMLEQVSEYGTAIGFTTYVTGDLLNNQLSSSSTGIGKTGRASNTGSSLKTSLRYNMPKTPIRTPIGTVQAPTRLVSGVANTASKIAKAAPLISVGFTAIDIFATQTVKTSHVFNTMYTAGAMIAGGPAGLIMGGGYLLAEGVAWMCGTSVSETIDGIADYFGLSGGIIWDW
jgi:RHS repeat-associated protein